MKELTLTTETLEQLTKQETLPILVDFWATWCGPCRMLAPVIDELAQAYDGRLIVGKVNVDEQTDLARAFGIESIPTLLLFRDGEVVRRVVGYHTLAELEAMLEL